MSNEYNTADYKFIPKEIGNGYEQWALECYPQTSQLPFRRVDGVLYINFSRNTSEETMRAIQRLLEENVINFSFVG